jgi:hypothetical protein
MEKLLFDGSVAEIQQAIVARRFSICEIAGWYLDRIERLDRARTVIQCRAHPVP